MIQTVILAGGRGSRMSTLEQAPPKAMVEVAGFPLIEHVMGIYRAHGYKQFLVATGHKHESIHSYFDRPGAQGDGRVNCVYTGESTQNGGRLKRLQPLIKGKTFLMTWTDGFADIDIGALLAFHRQHGRLATLTAVRPPPRFGHLTLGEQNRVTDFDEKPEGREGWINGAFFVLQREVLELISGDFCEFERDVLTPLAQKGQLMAYKHTGLWHCADTADDLQRLELLDRQMGLPGGHTNAH
jgi:glucose-1-phosphate cytidylyltransferase